MLEDRMHLQRSPYSAESHMLLPRDALVPQKDNPILLQSFTEEGR